MRLGGAVGHMVGGRAEVGLFQGGLLAFQAGDKNAVIQTDATNVGAFEAAHAQDFTVCLLYTSPSPRDATLSRMPSSA